jgi:hypothetical protein
MQYKLAIFKKKIWYTVKKYGYTHTHFSNSGGTSGIRKLLSKPTNLECSKIQPGNVGYSSISSGATIF